MNRGLLIKSSREGMGVLLILAPALMIVEGILSYVLPTFLDDFSSQLLQVPFFQSILKALLGTDIGSFIGPEAIIAMTWVHPVVLAIVWTQAVVYCTRLRSRVFPARLSPARRALPGVGRAC